MPKAIINDFSGGITDFPEKAADNFYSECDNLTIRPDNGLVQRQGCEPYDSSPVTYGTEGIDGIFNENDVSGLVIRSGAELFNSGGSEITSGWSLGSDVITYGNFSDTAKWTKGTGWTISSNRAVATVATGDLVSNFTFTTTTGKWYLLAFDMLDWTTGDLITVSFGGATMEKWPREQRELSADATGFTGYISYRCTTGSASTTISLLTSGSAKSGKIDNLTLKPIEYSGSNAWGSVTSKYSDSFTTNDHLYITNETKDALKYFKFDSNFYLTSLHPGMIQSSDVYYHVILGGMIGIPKWITVNGLRTGLSTKYTFPDHGGAYKYSYMLHYSYQYRTGTSSDYIEYEDVGRVVFHNNYPKTNPISVTDPIVFSIFNYSLETDYNDMNRMVVKIYRTKDNGYSYYYIGEVNVSSSTKFVDYTADNDILESLIYTSGNILEHDICSSAKCCRVLNNVAYYGNVRFLKGSVVYQRRLYQSTTGSLGGLLPTGYLDFDDNISGLGIANNKLIVFTEKKIYRIDGVFDDFGSGGMASTVIANNNRLKSFRSIIEADNSLFFAGSDGFYATDAYNVIKLPKKFPQSIDERYKNISGAVCGSYDFIRKEICWGATSNPDIDNDMVYVYNMDKDAFTTMSGIQTNAILFDRNYSGNIDEEYGMIRGTLSGQLMQHAYRLVADKIYDTVTSTWIWKAIEWAFIHLKFNFGSPNLNKLVNKITFNIPKPLSTYSGGYDRANNGNITLFPSSINNNANETDMKEIRIVDANEANFHNVTQTGLAYTEGVDSVKTRRFPNNQLRCRTKKISIDNKTPIAVAWSHMTGAGYGDVSVLASTKVAHLISGSWPTNIQGMSLKINGNSYVIKERTDDTNLLLVTAIDIVNQPWEIVGIEAGQVMMLDNFEYDYTPFDLGGTQYVKASEDAGNG